MTAPVPVTAPCGTARQWAAVFPVVDFDALPADGVITSLDQIRQYPAVRWIERWLPYYEGPEDLVMRPEFERRLGAAFRAYNAAEAASQG